MAYLLKRDEKVADGVRRIAVEQASDALERLTSPGDGDNAVSAVHNCRKRCKKVRGLIRLVRPALGPHYAPANAAFRDAARAVSEIRDTQSLLGTFDDLVAGSPDQLPAGGLAGVRAGLRADAARATELVGADSRPLLEARGSLAAGLASIDAWRLDHDGWTAIDGGLAKTYRRGRKALAEVQEAPTAENFHEWRKRAKYTWYHLRLLADAAPSVLGPLATRFHRLSNALGDAHDLDVLATRLREHPDHYGGDTEVTAAFVVIDGQRSRLERAAIGVGLRLYAEPADAFAVRVGRYWSAWQEHGEENDVGGLTGILPPVDGLEGLSTKELRSRASAADVVGRSAMTRDDLIGELRVVSATRHRDG